MSVKNEGKESKAKEREEEEEESSARVTGVRKESRVRRRKNCKSTMEGNVCGGRQWSAVVRCKSPSTAFNYDVIANTDDGYFLRYTLYITRSPTASPKPKAVEALSV